MTLINDSTTIQNNPNLDIPDAPRTRMGWITKYRAEIDKHNSRYGGNSPMGQLKHTNYDRFHCTVKPV